MAAADHVLERTFERTLRQWRRGRADRRLFRELVAGHGLDRRNARLLAALAQHHRLVRSAEIFLRPSLFAVNPDPALWRPRDVRALRERLFGADEEAPPAPGTGDGALEVVGSEQPAEETVEKGVAGPPAASDVEERDDEGEAPGAPPMARAQPELSASDDAIARPSPPALTAVSHAEAGAPGRGTVLRETIEDPAVPGAIPTIRE